jgi:long-subunit fatty acid transport protein
MDRNITTTLTTISAPSYVMPAVAYGTNWTNLTIGLGYQIDPKTVIRASYTQQISQQNVSSYNTAINLTARF